MAVVYGLVFFLILFAGLYIVGRIVHRVERWTTPEIDRQQLKKPKAWFSIFVGIAVVAILTISCGVLWTVGSTLQKKIEANIQRNVETTDQ
jgi:uncharacterized membrane protein